MLYRLFLTTSAIVGAAAAPLADRSLLWVTSVPTYVRPYAIAHNDATGFVVGSQVYRFPVTGPSSDYAFTLIGTSAPESAYLGVLPHTHQVHYENFFNLKGNFQLWTEKDGSSNARVMSPGDYGAVPHNTTHTFQITAPDTELVGIIQPGGFEDLFYALASTNTTYKTLTPYDPSIADANSSPPASVISALQVFDVYAELDFVPRRDLINGTTPSNTTWHDGDNTLATNAYTPFFVARDYGPKYLVSSPYYQVIQPLVTSVQSAGNFTLSTITIEHLLNASSPKINNYPGHAALEVLDGQLWVAMEGEVISLIQGDVVFIPGNTTYSYYSTVSETKFLHIGSGSDTLDTALIKEAKSWNSPVWPTS